VIPNGTCQLVVATLTGHDYFYHYALYSDVTGVWIGPGDGDQPFCVHRGDRQFFNRDSGGFGSCDDASHMRVMFRRVDTAGRQSHTVTLKPL